MVKLGVSTTRSASRVCVRYNSYCNHEQPSCEGLYARSRETFQVHNHSASPSTAIGRRANTQPRHRHTDVSRSTHTTKKWMLPEGATFLQARDDARATERPTADNLENMAVLVLVTESGVVWPKKITLEMSRAELYGQRLKRMNLHHRRSSEGCLSALRRQTFSHHSRVFPVAFLSCARLARLSCCWGCNFSC